MKLEFAKYHDITEVAHDFDSEYQQYQKVLICVDVYTFWLARIQEGWRDDEEEGYVQDEHNTILERNNIEKEHKGQKIETMKQLLDVLEEDDFSNWDVENCDSVEDAVDMLDDGSGFGEPIKLEKNS